MVFVPLFLVKNMKSKPPSPSPSRVLNNEDVSAYAFHLYEQSGGQNGRDLDNWLEAEACLRTNIPPLASHLRLHHYLKHPRRAHRGFTMPPSDACLEPESELPKQVP